MYSQQKRANSISSTKNRKKATDLFETIKYWLEYDYKDENKKNLYYNMISYWYLILRTKYNKKLYSDEMKKKIKIIDKELLKYNENYKVKKAYKLSKIIGYNLTLVTLKFYMHLKNKGLIKL